MTVRLTVVRTDDGAVHIVHTILYEQKLWLVPEWHEGPTEGTLRPARIICIDGLSQDIPEPSYHADLALTYPLNKDIFYGHKASQKPLAIEQPDVLLNEAYDFHR